MLQRVLSCQIHRSEFLYRRLDGCDSIIDVLKMMDDCKPLTWHLTPLLFFPNRAKKFHSMLTFFRSTRQEDQEWEASR